MQSTLKRRCFKNITNYLVLSLIIILLAFFVFSFCVTGVSILQIGKFVLYVLLCLFLPGYVIARKAVAFKNSSETYAFSLMLGIALCVLFYFADEVITKTVLAGFCNDMAMVFKKSLPNLSYMFNSHAVFMCLGGPVLSIFGILFLVSDIRNKRIDYDTFKIKRPLMLILLLAVFISFCGMYLKSGINPSILGRVTGYKDLEWTIGNAVTLMKGFPPIIPQYDGMVLNHHTIACVFRVSLIRFTGCSAVDATLLFSPLITTSILVFSLHSLGMRWFRDDNRKTLVFIISCVLVHSLTRAGLFWWNLDYAESAISNYIQPNLFKNVLCYPNGIDVSLSVLILVFVMLMSQPPEKRANIWYYISAMLFVMLCTGSKAPFGLCLCAVLFATIVFRLFQKKKLKENTNLIICFVFMLISFLGTYQVFLRNHNDIESTAIYEVMPQYPDGESNSLIQYEDETYTTEAGKNHGSVILGWLVEHSEVYSNYLTKNIPLTDSQQRILSVALIPLHLLMTYPMCFIPFIIYVIEQLKKFKRITLENILACGMCICGILPSYIVFYDGMSNIYFLFVASVFIKLIAVKWIFDNWKSSEKTLKGILSVLLISGMFSGICTFAAEIKEGVRNTIEITTTSDVVLKNKELAADSITAYEYEGLAWLRDNTDEQSLIAIDRFYQFVPKTADLPRTGVGTGASYFYYTAYSERNAFLGSWEYMGRSKESVGAIRKRKIINDALYNPDVLNKRELMDANGIEYIVVSRYVNGNLEIEADGLRKVFENRDIKIYGRE